MRYRNYIFDLDGTLWDAAPAAAKGFTLALKELANRDRVVTEEDIHQTFGKPLSALATHLLPDLPLEESERIIGEGVQYQYDEMDGNFRELVVPYMLDTIKELHRHGAGIFIVSNCLDGYIDLFYRNMPIQWYVTDQAWLHKPGHSKADNIRYMVEKYNLQNTCYVGDIQGDYEAATQAGVDFIHAAYGYGEVPEAKHVINEFVELLK